MHRAAAQQPESARQLTCHHVLLRKRPTAHLLPRAAEKAPGSPFATACRRESAWQPTCRRVPSRLPAPGPPRKRPAARLPSRAAENAPGSPLAAACRRESGTGSPLVTACRRESAGSPLVATCCRGSARQPACRRVHASPSSCRPPCARVVVVWAVACTRRRRAGRRAGPMACTRADYLHQGARKRPAPRARVPPRAAEKAPGSPLAVACRRESARQPACRHVLPMKRPTARLPPRARVVVVHAAACTRRRRVGRRVHASSSCRRETQSSARARQEIHVNPALRPRPMEAKPSLVPAPGKRETQPCAGAR